MSGKEWIEKLKRLNLEDIEKLCVLAEWLWDEDYVDAAVGIMKIVAAWQDAEKYQEEGE